MTSKINDIVAPLVPVQVDFYWAGTTELSFAVEGHTYPYLHQEDEEVRTSDARYKVKQNFINTPITFDAVDAGAEGHAKVIIPTGVEVVEYLWDFGDGTTGKGPTVNHTYKVAAPEVGISLTVTDTRGLRFSCFHQLNLIYATSGNIASLRRRV